MDCIAISTATISPTWFDCVGPGTLTSLFKG
jgi:hypothetical protein